jgi:diguanylate cyclase (GGDEF)-like protein
MSENIRNSDVLGRWGGEEFLIILNGLKSNKTLEQISEKIRTLIECSSLQVVDSFISVTVSIGATAYIQGTQPQSIVRGQMS